MHPDLKYFYGEVAEEGELLIAFNHLHNSYNWTLERFKIEVERAFAEGICRLLSRREGAGEASVGADAIDFSSEDGLRFVSFEPSGTAWEAYNKFV